jgi:hypothetical protein
LNKPLAAWRGGCRAASEGTIGDQSVWQRGDRIVPSVTKDGLLLKEFEHAV